MNDEDETFSKTFTGTEGQGEEKDDPPVLREENAPDPTGSEKKRKSTMAAEAGMMMWGGDDDDDTPPVPKYGGMVRIKNNKPGYADEVFAWSGTDPDASTVMMYSWSVALKAWTIGLKDIKEGGTRIQRTNP